MPKLHLGQPGFTYSACGRYTEPYERIQKFWKKGDLNHFYKNKLDKACFADASAHSNSNDLAKKTI